MDPATLLTAALVGGASAALKDTVAQAVKDAYAGLKRLVLDGYEKLGRSLQDIEDDPADEDYQRMLEKKAAQSEATEDEALMAQAQALLDLLRQHDPEAASIVLNFDDAEIQGSLEAEDLQATGDVEVSARKAKIGQDVKIKGVQAGSTGPSR
ncbi:MAG: hypothetical protein AAGI71_17170 [Bacteroidota bacterium]